MFGWVFFQKYFITLKAETAANTVSASTDGVTFLDTTQLLSGTAVFDGAKCEGLFDKQFMITNFLVLIWELPNDVHKNCKA